MKPEVKKLWVEALRSGEYTQGRGQLKGAHQYAGENCYCVLGVLCAEHLKKHPETFDFTRSGMGYGPLNDDGVVRLWKENDGAFLPTEVLRWAGLENDDIWLGIPSSSAIWSLNDNGYDFSKLADLIEAQL